MQSSEKGFPQRSMTKIGKPGFDARSYLAQWGTDRTQGTYRLNQVIFSQGDAAHSLFYIHYGKIKLSIVSRHGKQAVVGILGAGKFFGEECLAGENGRRTTSTAMSRCFIAQLETAKALRMLRQDPGFSEMFLQDLLARSIRLEEHLVDQLTNFSENRLAGVLLRLASFGGESKPRQAIGRISQQTLGEMAGMTRCRAGFFMNKFRKLGLISYDGDITVHYSLVNFASLGRTSTTEPALTKSQSGS